MLLSELLKSCCLDGEGGKGVLLDHGDIHWSGRACAVYLLVGHVLETSIIYYTLRSIKNWDRYTHVLIDRLIPHTAYTLAQFRRTMEAFIG